MSKKPKRIFALSKGLRVLAVLGQATSPMALNEITLKLSGDAFRFTPNGVLRVLESLELDGFARQNADKRWMATAKCKRLAPTL